MSDNYEELSEEALDELVHELKSAEAAEINNQGRDAQLAYVRDKPRETKTPICFVATGGYELIDSDGNKFYPELPDADLLPEEPRCPPVVWNDVVDRFSEVNLVLPEYKWKILYENLRAFAQYFQQRGWELREESGGSRLEVTQRDLIEALFAQVGDYPPINSDWSPSAENINALPAPVREYIRQLETRCDPTGDMRQIWLQRENLKALGKDVERLRAFKQEVHDTLDELGIDKFEEEDCRIRPRLKQLKQRCFNNPYPMQPIELDPDGRPRFRANAIVRFLKETSANDMNALAVMPFSNEDREQFAQLIGYSVCGFGGLPYVNPRTVKVADSITEELLKGKQEG